ncbi:MAG: hypothetical protein GEV11_03020 [Streptosporangiales bacterium]|nr:hypothetical protein [Streptosporangiales bacterium]
MVLTGCTVPRRRLGVREGALTAYSLDHVAIVVPSWGVGGRFLEGVLGGRWTGGTAMPEMSPGQLAFGNDTRVELLEPGTAPESFVTKFLDRSGGRSRPHHITFKVADIERSIDAVRRAGFEAILTRLDNEYWKETFIHPRATGLGFLTQLAQTGRSSGPDGPRPAPWPEPADAPAVPADLRFIVSHVRDLDPGRRVLTEVLGAVEEKCEAPAGWQARRFFWPAGADLILATADELPNGPGIQALGIRPPASFDMPVTPVGRGYAVTAPVPELGLALLVPAD